MKILIRDDFPPALLFHRRRFDVLLARACVGLIGLSENSQAIETTCVASRFMKWMLEMLWELYGRIEK